MECQVQSPKLLHQVRNVLRLHHYSIHTERSYLDWITQTLLTRAREDEDLHRIRSFVCLKGFAAIVFSRQRTAVGQQFSVPRHD